MKIASPCDYVNPNALFSKRIWRNEFWNFNFRWPLLVEGEEFCEL